MIRHITDQICRPNLVHDSTLHVIGVITNPVRYHSRYRLYRAWEQAMQKNTHIKLYTVEAAYGDRCHEVTEAGNPMHLQLRTNSDIWIKENLINLGVKNLLPANWRYVAWVDCDVFFRSTNWALETIHQLQTFPVIQPWSDCADLGPNGNISNHYRSFGRQHQSRLPKQTSPIQYYYQYAHSGYAWAARRDLWENVGGLMDFAILGSADHHMAWAMVGQVDSSVHAKMSPGFFKRCHDWQRKAIQVTQKEVGFSPGRIEHEFHGPKKLRYYRERWQILIDHKFDPDKHLMYDSSGMVKLINNPGLEQAIRMYNRARHEDSIEENL